MFETGSTKHAKLLGLGQERDGCSDMITALPRLSTGIRQRTVLTVLGADKTASD
jgi:hypothetical protein